MNERLYTGSRHNPHVLLCFIKVEVIRNIRNTNNDDDLHDVFQSSDCSSF